MGIEPTLSAWKAEVLPLNYTRMVEGAGFEPAKAEPSDLQSDPFDRSGIPPLKLLDNYKVYLTKNQAFFMIICILLSRNNLSNKKTGVILLCVVVNVKLLYLFIELCIVFVLLS